MSKIPLEYNSHLGFDLDNDNNSSPDVHLKFFKFCLQKPEIKERKMAM